MNLNTFVTQYPILFFLIIWVVIVYFVSYLSGWRQLAREYAASHSFEGKPHRFQTIWMRWGSHYGNLITIGINSQGLHVSVLFLFRTGHDPLFIPWSEMTAEETSGLIRRVRLRFKRKPSVPFMIERRLADIMSKESMGTFSVHPDLNTRIKL